MIRLKLKLNKIIVSLGFYFKFFKEIQSMEYTLINYPEFLVKDFKFNHYFLNHVINLKKNL